MARSMEGHPSPARPPQKDVAASYREAMKIWIDRHKDAMAQLRAVEDHAAQVEQLLGKVLDVLTEEQIEELRDRP